MNLSTRRLFKSARPFLAMVILGLAIDLEPRPAKGPWFGASTADQNGAAVIASIELDSPASRAGLSARDEILAVDGMRTNPRSLAGTLGAHKTGGTVIYSRRGAVRETDVVLGLKSEPSYAIKPLADPTPAQKALRDAWLK
jgi:predicted metalloprotease with PDZ domain